MIIYSGLGILAPLIAFISYMGCMTAMDATLGNAFIDDNSWAKAIPLAGTGAALFVFGIMVNRIMVGKEQLQQNPELKYNHTFFLFPIEYWSVLAFGMALIAAIKGWPS